jgi:hypothetical protein
MPRIDLISKDEAITVGDAEGFYIIRRLPVEMAREIRDRHTKRIEPETPGAFPREETDWPAVELDQLDYVIQDWKVFGPDGTPAACTRANKNALPRGERDAVLQVAGATNRSGELSGPLRPLKPTLEAEAVGTP